MQNENFNNPFLAEYHEKREIKQAGKCAGLALFANLSIMALWSLAYFRVTSYFGLGADEAYALKDNPAFSLLLQVFISLAMLLIPYGVFARCSFVKPSRIISFARPKKGLLLPGVLAGVGFCLLASVLTGIAGQLFERMGIDAPIAEFDMPDGILGFILSVLAISVVPAFVEEFVMRGILMGTLKKYGDGFAVIASAYVFGIMHASFNQIPFAFLLGLAFGIVAIKTGSIWTVVLIHFINNFISVIFSYLEGIFSTEWYLFANNILIFAATLCLIAGLVMLSNRDKNFFKFGKSEYKSSTKTEIFWFLSCPAVILATVASLLIATFLR